MKRAVVRDDGRRYDSIMAAARAMRLEGVSSDQKTIASGISAACNGKNNIIYAYGHRWHYDGMDYAKVNRKIKEHKPSGQYTIASIPLDKTEWMRFKAKCDELDLMLREGGAEAIRRWIGGDDGPVGDKGEAESDGQGDS